MSGGSHASRPGDQQGRGRFSRQSAPEPPPQARGLLAQSAGALTPAAAASLKVMAERDLGLRAARLASSLRDAVGERVRPSRRRMRSLMLFPGGRLHWRSVPAPPAPGPLGAVVHPMAMATCDMDRPMALGRTPFVLPLHFGHECVAEVLAVGSDVQDVRPGQRVVVPFQINCGACHNCRVGHTANCLSVPPISMYGFGLAGGHWGGTLADEMAVPFADAMLVPLPDALTPAAAASVADNVSDAYRHVGPYLSDLLARDPDAEVRIFGALSKRSVFTPSVPLYAGLVALALGARRVTFVDARAAARAHGERLGLTTVSPDQLRGQPPAPLVVDSSAEPRGHRLAIANTAPDGICSNAGSLHASCRIPIGLMYGRNITLKVSRSHARAIIPHVLELMASGRLRPEDVTTLQASLDEAPAALAEHMAGRSVKTILVA